MDIDFQDRIDEYLLHGNNMSEEAKAQFEKEIEEDAEKREQYEFTKRVKQAMESRGEKLKAMAAFEKGMNRHHGKRIWMWVSGMAAALIVGFFAVSPLFVVNDYDGNIRGTENDVFVSPAPTDSIGNNATDSLHNDSTPTDSTARQHE